MATRPWKLLFSQQRGSALQVAPDPAPTTVTGVQVRPTIALTSWTTTPRTASSLATGGSDVVPEELQHWTGPVLHWDAGAPVAVALKSTTKKVRKGMENEREFGRTQQGWKQWRWLWRTLLEVWLRWSKLWKCTEDSQIYSPLRFYTISSPVGSLWDA